MVKITVRTRNYYRKELLPNRNFTLEAANRKLEKTFMALMNTSASKWRHDINKFNSSCREFSVTNIAKKAKKACYSSAHLR